MANGEGREFGNGNPEGFESPTSANTNQGRCSVMSEIDLVCCYSLYEVRECEIFHQTLHKKNYNKKRIRYFSQLLKKRGRWM